ncbi:hypothetical protein [Cupriavidus numazuensis]|uniref:Uncharacterized protein n=1 Tax=Cupriavidus numazuensis TaxID=221992 RepID=A0ABN7PVN0_9BURK|nr:hypothetical protein [Cupriavidus numazuensis]CAG2136136.1 hypothetical protein LMG26411_01200 [Cupriavidus numazuensis]
MEFYEDFSKDQTVTVVSGHRFEIPAFPDQTGANEKVLELGKTMWRLVDEWSGKLKSIRSDQRFSDFGRAEHIVPIAETANLRLLGAWNLASTYEMEIDAREHAIIHIPKIADTHSVAHLEDREIRDWWSRQDVKTRTKFMEQSGEPGSDAERMALAILRSPIPQSDVEKTYFRRVWEDSRRAENPVEAESIQLGRQSLEWVTKNIQFVSVVTQHSFKDVPREHILKYAIAQDKVFSPHIGRLGFSSREIAQMQLRMRQGR